MSDFDIYSNPFRNFWSGIQDFNGHSDYKQNPIMIIFKKTKQENKRKMAKHPRWKK